MSHLFIENNSLPFPILIDLERDFSSVKSFIMLDSSWFSEENIILHKEKFEKIKDLDIVLCFDRKVPGIIDVVGDINHAKTICAFPGIFYEIHSANFSRALNLLGKSIKAFMLYGDALGYPYNMFISPLFMDFVKDYKKRNSRQFEIYLDCGNFENMLERNSSYSIKNHAKLFCSALARFIVKTTENKTDLSCSIKLINGADFIKYGEQKEKIEYGSFFYTFNIQLYTIEKPLTFSDIQNISLVQDTIFLTEIITMISECKNLKVIFCDEKDEKRHEVCEKDVAFVNKKEEIFYNIKRRIHNFFAKTIQKFCIP